MIDIMQKLWGIVLDAGSQVVGLATLVVIVAIYLFPVFVVVGAIYLWFEYRREQYGEGPVDGMLLASAYRYAPTHMWVGGHANGGRKVGLDDLGRRIIGAIQRVELPKPGTIVAAGEPVATLVSHGTREVLLRAPVTGVIVDVNHEAVADPGLIEQAPYTKGWLFAIRAERSALREMPTGMAAREWFRREEHRFGQFLEQQFGLQAADGGGFVVPPSSILPDDKWRELVREFIG